jgi:hypothetical protein
MKRSLGILAGTLAVGMVAAATVWAASTPASKAGWLHVRVEEAGKGSKVSVNLPLTVVEAALKAAPETLESHGRVHFGKNGHGMSLADLRQMWKAVKDAGDTDFVTVEEPDGENVKVARRGELVEVHVTKGGKQQVTVQLPVSLVDVLLSGEGDQLNVRAAMAELQNRRGDIVRVNDEQSTVRIWIDEQN